LGYVAINWVGGARGREAGREGWGGSDSGLVGAYDGLLTNAVVVVVVVAGERKIENLAGRWKLGIFMSRERARGEGRRRSIYYKHGLLRCKMRVMHKSRGRNKGGERLPGPGAKSGIAR
jgi:hypothetical protein